MAAFSVPTSPMADGSSMSSNSALARCVGRLAPLLLSFGLSDHQAGPPEPKSHLNTSFRGMRRMQGWTVATRYYDGYEYSGPRIKPKTCISILQFQMPFRTDVRLSRRCKFGYSSIAPEGLNLK